MHGRNLESGVSTRSNASIPESERRRAGQDPIRGLIQPPTPSIIDGGLAFQGVSVTNPRSTVELLSAYRSGDDSARDRLVERCLPLLLRWARGRLPAYGRSMAETDDLVQVSLMRALNNLETFDAKRPGALLGYLRTILMNAVREEIRRTRNQRIAPDYSRDLVDPARSVLDQAIGREQIEAYERALGELTDAQREAVVLRLEFGMSYPEIAVELKSNSPDAARMLVTRGLVALAEAMK